MAPKNALAQSSRKTTRSTSQVSTTTSLASGGVMSWSMAKAAATFAKKQTIVTATSQSLKITNVNSKISDGVSQITSHALKQKSFVSFNMQQTILHERDEL